ILGAGFVIPAKDPTDSLGPLAHRIHGPGKKKNRNLNRNPAGPLLPLCKKDCPEKIPICPSRKDKGAFLILLKGPDGGLVSRKPVAGSFYGSEPPVIIPQGQLIEEPRPKPRPSPPAKCRSQKPPGRYRRRWRSPGSR